MTANRFVLLKRKEKREMEGKKEKEEEGRVPNKASLFSRENKSTKSIVGKSGHRSFRSGFLGKNRVVPTNSSGGGLKIQLLSYSVKE